MDYYNQRASYEAMRRSQEAAMRRSNTSVSSQQSLSNYSQPYSGRDSRDSQASRGSGRGSQDGLRMSSGPEMAGVGIFFQQEPNTGKVYVANIVPGGSADRSGVIRVNDVIVKVDDEDVQGQPLSTLRNLILGRQGSYVVLAFRRMTGTELYYFDVELLRGTPEYFESLKKKQANADEKEKLITQVRQQEQEIQHLKQTNLRSSGGSSGGMPLPMPAPVSNVTIEHWTRELQMKVQEAKRLEEMIKQTKEDSILQNDAENAAQSLRSENRRLEDTLQSTRAGITEMQKRIQEEETQLSHEKARMEKQLAEVQRSSARNTGSASQGVQENQQLKAALLQRQQRGAEIKRKLADTVSVMQDALKNSEETTRLLHELVPGLDKLQMQLMAELGR